MSQMFNSQTVGFGLLLELLTNDAELAADILADARDFAADAFEVLSLLHLANFFSGFPARRLRFSSHSIM